MSVGYNRAKPSFVYTHHLPYGIRREICNLLDADQSWRALGGQFIGLDATQLTLIGQAYMRNCSPTEELLNKLDSANFRISEFCSYLRQMNNCRALEILEPFAAYSSSMDPFSGSEPRMLAKHNTLDTPTPSFIERPAAIMMCCNEPSPFENAWPQAGSHRDTDWRPQDSCHQSVAPQQGSQLDKQAAPDPGEEIVRMACANNRKRTSISDQEVVNQLRLIMQITYNELKQASNNFSDSNILGNGGFASVYRGHWKGTDVAIKRLKCNLMDQALNELTILNSYRIDNILPIYGISIDGPEACLVYQFMSNGSLEDRLSCKKETPPLTWGQRAMIGEGVAKGLYYLHTLRDKPLVHGDVKSANVLLDSQFVPKLGDFGLARQVFRGRNPQTELCTHCTVSSIHGTSVYLPPEYLRHKILSPAVDVYSYGIVLLEMATGRRAYDGKRLLIEVVEDETRSMSMGQIGYSLKDPRLADDTESELKIWVDLVKLGLQCAHKIKKKRPDIGQLLAKFADFRSSSEGGAWQSGCPPPAGMASSNGSQTARTLTPDSDALDHRNQRQPGAPKLASNFNSALMSVEEEPEPDPLGRLNGHRPPEAEAAGPVESSEVEAMIPLLTELGVVAQQD